MIYIASNITFLRENMHLKKCSLDKYMSAAKSTTGRWEGGKATPNYAQLEFLSNFFRVSIDFLVKKDLRNTATSEIKRNYTLTQKKINKCK